LIDDPATAVCKRAQASAPIPMRHILRKNTIAGRIDKTPGRCAIFVGLRMAYVDHRN
jgi:hypothetical protein